MFLLTKGGFMMWGILLASFLSVSIIIDRVLFYKKAVIKPDAFFNKIKDILQNTPTQSNIDHAITVCEDVKSPLADIFKVILVNQTKGREQISELAESQTQIILPKLEERLTPLKTISSIAPLLGLLGTVIGMIKSFAVISQGDVASASVAEGISNALFTTAAGLFVAIPCIVMYNYFARKVDLILNDIDVYSKSLIDHIKK